MRVRINNKAVMEEGKDMKCKKGKNTLITVLTFAVLTLAACGGGGSGGSSLTNSDSTGSGGLTNSDGTGSLTNSNGSGSDESTSNKNIDPPLASALSVAWDAPTTNIDGSSLNDLAGYKIHYGTSSGNYTTVVDVGNATSYTFAELNTGSWCFAVTTYNAAGAESDYSNEVCT